MDYLSLINKNLYSKETRLAKSRNKTEEETFWQRLRKRIPRLDYQDRELLWIGRITCVNWRYLVRGFHSVRYPVRWKTENRSWSVSLQWYIYLTLSSEHLVGFCCHSYCAYSDTEVGCKLDTWVISSLLFDFLHADINIS